jgi:hypothetical protein
MKSDKELELILRLFGEYVILMWIRLKILTRSYILVHLSLRSFNVGNYVVLEEQNGRFTTVLRCKAAPYDT